MEFNRTRDFFEAFKGNQISSLDQLNYIEEKTKNDPKKLKALIADLEIYMGGFEIKNGIQPDPEFAGRGERPKMLIEKFNSFKLRLHSLIEEASNSEVDLPLLNLSSTSAQAKLIYLNELGIIDFLREKKPFKTSVNKLATVLSAITDERASTLQPALNSMLSAYTNAPEKSPYHSKKTAPKIQKHLIEIGFDTSK